VREYARRTGVGAREYRVVRGSSIDAVYRSAERVRATAVGTALNELESRERSLEHPDREGADLRHPTSREPQLVTRHGPLNYRREH